MGQICILKPEVTILLELYEAEHSSIPIKTSIIGLAAGIPQTTSHRYLRFLEECGMVFRYPHLTDQRVSFVRLAPAFVAKLDRVFFGDPWPSLSDPNQSWNVPSLNTA
ncbi:MarR family winged helix-turn-helix transcriptional regulator [Erythrobacter oryzae]|uniref:MarR family winged helix-turn-helix transcriptional regulator n=1 Tax=Erythrobacter oryzae TaxID=3019556 RepID=UPI0025576C45|nr:MarR family winged helix-turn-helix transcriptional regulator [Erythrobacter sp. COR-2]